MNGPEHQSIVRDAVSVMSSGNNLGEYKAAWHLSQLAGGKNQLLALLTAEASETDHYSDLQFYIPFPVMTDYAEYHGMWTTGLNHYLNAFLVQQNWDLANGYCYPWSSQSTLDEDFHSFWMDLFNVNIEDNPDKSPVLGRLPSYWLENTRTWGDNWAARLPFSEYAPCSAVAATYYDQLINHYNTPMFVNVYGNKHYLAGLQKLGPVLHFIGDVVVPQHVRAAHGFCHVEWENSLQQLAANGRVHLDTPMVRNILTCDPFRGYLWQGGPLNGEYAVDYVMVGMADMTREQTQAALHLNLNDLFDAGDAVWSALYITQTLAAAASSPGNIFQYLYNLGVAGCVHTLRRASEDLRRKNIGPQPPDNMQFFLPFILQGVQMTAISLHPVAMVRSPEQMLRFRPNNRTGISRTMGELEETFAVDSFRAIEHEHLAEVLRRLEAELQQEFTAQPTAQQMHEMPDKFDSGQGLYAYRLPTMEECSNEQNLRRYLELSGIHQYKAYLLDLTTMIAAANAQEQRAALTPENDRIKRQLVQRREAAIGAGRGPMRRAEPLPEGVHLIGAEGRPMPHNIRV